MFTYYWIASWLKASMLIIPHHVFQYINLRRLHPRECTKTFYNRGRNPWKTAGARSNSDGTLVLRRFDFDYLFVHTPSVITRRKASRERAWATRVSKFPMLSRIFSSNDTRIYQPGKLNEVARAGSRKKFHKPFAGALVLRAFWRDIEFRKL